LTLPNSIDSLQINSLSSPTPACAASAAPASAELIPI